MVGQARTVSPAAVRKTIEPLSRTPLRVYSWWQGRWWAVDRGADYGEMVASAARRQDYVQNRAARLNSDGRFVAVRPGETPQAAWEASNRPSLFDLSE